MVLPTDRAIRQKRRPARLRDRFWLPRRLPLCRVPGAIPSRAVNCFSVFQWLSRSVPVSDTSLQQGVFRDAGKRGRIFAIAELPEHLP